MYISEAAIYNLRDTMCFGRQLPAMSPCDLTAIEVEKLTEQ